MKKFTMHDALVFCVVCALLLLPRFASGDIRALDFGGIEPFEPTLSLAPSSPSRGAQGTGLPERDEKAIQAGIREISRRIEAGDLRGAQEQLDLSLTSFPLSPALLRMAAQMSSHMGRWRQATLYWSELVDVEPDNVDAWSAWGHSLIRLGELEKAEEVLRQAYDLDPYYTPTIVHLLTLYVATGREREGAALLRTMTAPDLGFIAHWMDVDYPVLVPLIGEEVYVRIGQLVMSGGESVAPADFEERPARFDFLTLSPGEGGFDPLTPMPDRAHEWTAEQMRERLSRVRDFIERYGEVVQAEEWARAADIGARSEMARLGFSAPVFRAHVLYARHRAGDDSARSALVDLCARYPSDLFTRILLVLVLMETEQYSDAERELRDVETLYPDHALVKLLLACALAETGRNNTALEMLETLDERVRPFVKRWFSSDAAYQQAILNERAFEAWRAEYVAPRE